MKLPSPINFLVQKLLYLWIKADVIQLAGAQTADDNTAVIYVLQSRAWTDLLVVEHECKSLNITQPLSPIKLRALKKWHHVYTVAQARPLKAWLQQKNKHSKMLSGIYQALKENPELDVQKHWLHVLFSDTWGLAGRTRRFFTILFNGKNTLLQFSPAISFRELINDPSQCDTVDCLQKLLSDRLNKIKTATLGPDISHRRTLVRQLLENKDIVNAVNNRCQQDNITQYKATGIAEKYLNEIVADRSYITIQIAQRILARFWNKFYSGIDVWPSLTSLQAKT